MVLLFFAFCCYKHVRSNTASGRGHEIIVSSAPYLVYQTASTMLGKRIMYTYLSTAVTDGETSSTWLKTVRLYLPLLLAQDKVNMVLNVHRNHKAYQGRREVGKGVWRWGKREIICLSLHCHHQNDSCIKVGSDESHFNVSLIVRDKVTRQCPQPTTFEEKGEPKQIRTEVALLTSLTPYR